MRGDNDVRERLRRSSGKLATALVAALALGALARARAEDKGEKGGFESMASRVQETVLANGLRVIVLEKHDAPVAAFMTVVNVGSAEEATGSTGLAHLFEHMAFKGSTTIGGNNWEAEKAALAKVEGLFEKLKAQKLANAPKDKLEAIEKEFQAAQEEAGKFVVPDEFSKILQRHGGAGLNAFTNTDVTAYHVELPSNCVELWFSLEADRFRDPVLREYYKEKGAVKEERRMRVESNPVGELLEEFLPCAFRAHPYSRPVIGFMSDLNGLSSETASKFFKRHYTPNNMTIAIVGDVDARAVFGLAEKYFGTMPRGPEIENCPTIEPPQKGERRVEFEAEVQQPVSILGWHIPAARDPDFLAVDALGDVLATGRTSRLYKSLVVEKKIAVEVEAGTGEPGQKYPNLFIIFLVPAPDHTIDECVAAVEEELQKVREKPVTDDELNVVKTRTRANFVRGLRGTMELAQGLALDQVVQGSWRQLFEIPGKVAKLTPADLNRVAKKYLTDANMTRGDLVGLGQSGDHKLVKSGKTDAPKGDKPDADHTDKDE